MKRSAAGLALSLLAGSAMAEEGGSGHYFPGSMSSFIDGVPATETQLVRLNLLGYEGQMAEDVVVPIAGLTAIGVDVESVAVGITALWRPPLDMGDRWSYAAAMTVPFVDTRVEADISVPRDPMDRTVRRSDSVSGLGDILLFPLMLNYNMSPALNYNLRLGIYAPTGDFEVGRLANQGKNYWSVEPTAAMVYLNPENGRELSVFLGVTFNTENSDTDYRSGNQAHMEFTAAQHFPLGGGLAGAGITGFWYHQLSGDSGDGASFGDFKARARGVGPALSWTTAWGSRDFVAEFQWLHESGVKNRPEGDTLFFKAVLKF